MTEISPLKRVTTVTEAAEMFGISPRAVRALIKKGRLSAEISGGVHLILIDSLISYFERKPQYIASRLIGFVEV